MLLVGGFGCLELVLYGVSNIMIQPIRAQSPQTSTNESGPDCPVQLPLLARLTGHPQHEGQPGGDGRDVGPAPGTSDHVSVLLNISWAGSQHSQWSTRGLRWHKWRPYAIKTQRKAKNAPHALQQQTRTSSRPVLSRLKQTGGTLFCTALDTITIILTE